MGSRKTLPPLPDWRPNLDADCQVRLRLQECNWLQALEGDIDTVHAVFLHSGHVRPDTQLDNSETYLSTQVRHARFICQNLELGASYAAARPSGQGSEYWRMGHFLTPFYTFNAPGLLGIKNNSSAWVPLDDENVMVWQIGPNRNLTPETETVGGMKAGYLRRDPIGKGDPYGGIPATGVRPRVFESNTGWLGRFRPIANKHNDYCIDRDLQRTMGTYTGVPRNAQDPMAQESMGPVYDRRQERLGTSDLMIIRTRRRLIEFVRAHEKGSPAPGVDKPELYRMRSGGAIVAAGINGLDALADLHFDRIPLEEFRARMEPQLR
jgi:hypothetical protein